LSIKAFYTEFSKGLKAPAYLIHSDESFLLKEVLFDIKGKVPDEEIDFRFDAFDMESAESSAPIEQVLDLLNTMSFMGGRRIVIVEGMKKLKVAELDPIKKYLENPSPDALLVMLYEGKPKKATKDRLAAAKTIPMTLSERELPIWLQERASRKDISFTKDAIEYLIGTIGTDAGLLSAEIEKFAMIGKKKLNRDDLAEIIKGYGDFDAFDLVAALRSKNAEQVFKVYTVLSQTQEPYSLLGVLNWHYGKTPLGQKERAKVFALLNEADLQVKSSGGTYPLELLFSKLLRL
jgi:DNA polymerase III delta subunit